MNNVTIAVSEPLHLCAVQKAARTLCEAAGARDGQVFEAVIAVTELGNRCLVGVRKAGRMELGVVRSKGRLGLEVTAQSLGEATTGHVWWSVEELVH